MKTVRTILVTFGMTTLLYGAFALFCVSIDAAFTNRSIYSMFRNTGFPFLVVGIACLLSVLIISFALSSFRDEVKNRKTTKSEEDLFLEEETVPEEEYEQKWSPELKRKSRDALAFEREDEPAPAEPQDDTPSLDESLFKQPGAVSARRCVFCGTEYPSSDSVCPKCGRRA